MIKFYSNNCPICKMLKLTMNKNGIEYEEINDIDIIIAIANENEVKSMPFAEINGDILSTNELKEYIKERTK